MSSEHPPDKVLWEPLSPTLLCLRERSREGLRKCLAVPRALPSVFQKAGLRNKEREKGDNQRGPRLVNNWEPIAFDAHLRMKHPKDVQRLVVNS
jgi:hypothetical protein